MAVNPKIRDTYRVTIGIETHVQLSTKTKLFSAVDKRIFKVCKFAREDYIVAGIIISY